MTAVQVQDPKREHALDGRVAIVTGGGSGVGRGIALALAADGARIVAVGRDRRTLDATVDTISSRGGEAISLECDVAASAETRACVDAAVAALGGVDIVVNAAHDVREGPVLDMTHDDWATDWWSGFGGTLHMMQACYPHLQKRAGSTVVNLCAATSLKPHAAGLATYASTKEAIRSLTRTAAMEWGPLGIRVNAVIPLARTEQFDRWAGDHPEAFATIIDSIPLGRLGDPEVDIGRVVAFLAGDRARWITGTTLMADGGRGYLR